jgi:hypothetical protein
MNRILCFSGTRRHWVDSQYTHRPRMLAGKHPIAIVEYSLHCRKLEQFIITIGVPMKKNIFNMFDKAVAPSGMRSLFANILPPVDPHGCFSDSWTEPLHERFVGIALSACLYHLVKDGEDNGPTLILDPNDNLLIILAYHSGSTRSSAKPSWRQSRR